MFLIHIRFTILVGYKKSLDPKTQNREQKIYHEAFFIRLCKLFFRVFFPWVGFGSTFFLRGRVGKDTLKTVIFLNFLKRHLVAKIGTLMFYFHGKDELRYYFTISLSWDISRSP